MRFLYAVLVGLALIGTAQAQQNGGAGTNPARYQLLSNATASGAAQIVQGGNYIVDVQGTFNGATVTLTANLNGVTRTVATFTAATATNTCFAIGAGTTVQMTITGGPPSAMFGSIASPLFCGSIVSVLGAGEAHIGEVGGNVLGVSVAQTVTASSAYASGNAVGGLITIAGAGRVAGGSGYVQNIAIRTKSAQTAEIDVILFRDNPTASTCTDKTALAVAAADFDKVIAPIQVTQWMSLGTPSVGYATNLALAYQLPTGATALYACLVTRGTPTYSLTSDLSVIYKLVRN